RELDELRDDVLVALDRAEALGRPDLLARLAAAAPSIFIGRGLLGPGRSWLRRALEMGPPERHAAVHLGLATVEMIRGALGASMRHAQAAARSDDPHIEATAHYFLLMMDTVLDPAAAERHIVRAHALDRLAPKAVSAVSLGIGFFHLWHEHDDAAAEAFD